VSSSIAIRVVVVLKAEEGKRHDEGDGDDLPRIVVIVVVQAWLSSGGSSNNNK
jgi:hypothetical protein